MAPRSRHLVCVRRSCRLQLKYSSLCVEVLGSAQHRRASGLTALPQGPSLRSGLKCPGPSSLNRPHPPYSPTRPNFPVVRVICGAFAVPAAAGLGRRRAVPSFRGHSFSACRPPRPRRVRRLRAPSSSSARFAFVHRSLDSALSTSHLIRFMWNPLSGSPGSLIRYNLLSCLPPLADLTRHSTLPSRRRLLLPSFRPSRLPFSPSDISTVASGHLHRQDSHLLERQLASLHERTGFKPPSPLDFALLQRAVSPSGK